MADKHISLIEYYWINLQSVYQNKDVIFKAYQSA